MAKEKSALVQGSILALAGIVTKVIGFLYRIPMANLLGNEGNGIYSVAFGIYNIALTLSSLSMPLAVSKMVSARLARKDTRNARRVFLDILLFATVAGAIACLALFFGADWLEELYARPGLSNPLRILAPTAFLVALLGTLRGWFQGHGNMVPTATSQILEQIANAVVSILAAWQLTRIYADDPQVSSWGAAGGTAGTLAGALVAVLFVAWLFLRDRPPSQAAKTRLEPHSRIYRELILTVIPVILSQTIYQIGYTLDDLIFSNTMISRGLEESEIASLQGVFNTQYNQLVNLPVAIAVALASSTVPGIVAASVSGSRRDAHRKISSVLKLNMAIAIPCAVGLAILAQPVMHLLFTSLGDKEPVAVLLLQTGSSAAVFYALSTNTTSILQASDCMSIPVFHSGVALAVHVVLVYILLRFTPLGVYGLVIGNVTFPMMVSFLNCRSLTRKLHYRWHPLRIFLIPLLAAGLMGVVTYVGYYAVVLFLPSWLALIISVLLSVFVYGYLLLRMHCFTDRQLPDLPMGRRLLALSRWLEGRH